MSQETVEAFKRALDAGNRRDLEALLQELDPDVEWHSVILASLGGEATVYRGHEGIREMFSDLSEAFAEIKIEAPAIRDLGDRIVATGQIRSRGAESGVETESPFAYIAEVKSGKAIRVRAYLDPKEALEAAGLRE
jgi:ketosteroid isomerase-like protein